MSNTVSLLMRLSATYKTDLSKETVDAWREALEDLHEQEIEQGLERMTREYKNPFLPPPGVFRKFSLRKDAKAVIKLDLPQKPDADYWMEQQEKKKQLGKRLDPVGAQKYFQAIGAAPEGFILDEDNIVRWDPNWRTVALDTAPLFESKAEETLINLMTKTERYHALAENLSHKSMPKAEDDAEGQMAQAS